MSQPADGVAGLSVAYRDLHGWHVQQMQDEGRVITNVIGESIDTAYVIASHMFSETSAGDIDFGSGPQETVQVFMNERNETTNTPTTTAVNNDQVLLIIAGAMPFAATIIVLFLILQRRKKEA